MANRIYDKMRWKRLRVAKLSQDPLCQDCQPNRITPATDVDHIKAISQGGDPWDWDNLRCLCHACHSRKTYHVDRMGGDAAPAKGCDVDGVPYTLPGR